MDLASELIAETRFVPDGGPPYEFVLHYDAGHIKPGLRYNLRASIVTAERLRFISDYAIDPFASQQPLEILVKSAAGDR